MSHSLRSWGLYPPYSQTASFCHWRADIKQTLAGVVARHGTTLPFGSGRSYGDSCLAASDHVFLTRHLDRVITANWETGLICAEAGVTLDELLRLAVPRGWFLPVTPGTRFVTLGGALANDVHGKNHHVRGTFGCHVPRFGLVRSDQPPLTCSPHEHGDLYAATIGGLGLTGIIDWVELQLVPIRSSLINVTQVRFDSLDEFFAISGELENQHQYTVAWIDCLASGNSIGRGVYLAGDHAAEGPLMVAEQSKLNVPLTPPVSAFNKLTLRLLNTAYYRSHGTGRCRHQMGYEPYFYPLDRVLHWNRIYGPKGFQQYQCVIPQEHAAVAIRELLNAIAVARSGSFLAVLKRFGTITSPGLISFPMPGTTLALDFPQQGDTTARLFARMDSIVRGAGGRHYPAKDAHMTREDFQYAYPGFEKLAEVSDPAMASRFWQRVRKLQ